MALEDLTGGALLGALNPAWPEADDFVDEGDDHIRGIKNVLKNQFPNMGDAPVTKTAAQLNEPNIPVGAVIDFAGLAAPPNYLVCLGQAVSRAAYPALWAAIGATWGAGDGSTTFNVPNLSRRTTIGSGGTAVQLPTPAVGALGGFEQHVLTLAEMPGHAHAVNATINASVQAGAHAYAVGASGATGTAGDVTYNAGSDQPHNNMQPSAVMLKLIRAQ